MAPVAGVDRVDMRKLTEHDKVNQRRARRLLKEFGSYEAVMSANYRDLLDVHYIGEETAKSVYRASKRQNTPTLL